MNALRNPPAFPAVHFDGEGNNCGTIQGMTLRDWFAGQALPAVIDVCRGDTDARKAVPMESYFAVKAYALADAMLAERAKGGA